MTLEKTILLTSIILAFTALGLAAALHLEFKKPIPRPHPELPRTSVSGKQILLGGAGSGSMSQTRGGIIHGWSATGQTAHTEGIWLSEDTPSSVAPIITNAGGTLTIYSDDRASSVSLHSSGEIVANGTIIGISKRGHEAITRLLNRSVVRAMK